MEKTKLENLKKGPLYLFTTIKACLKRVSKGGGGRGGSHHGRSEFCAWCAHCIPKGHSLLIIQTTSLVNKTFEVSGSILFFFLRGRSYINNRMGLSCMGDEPNG